MAKGAIFHIMYGGSTINLKPEESQMLNLEKKLAFRGGDKIGSDVRLVGRVTSQFPLVFAYSKPGSPNKESITQRDETGRVEGPNKSDFDIVNVIDKATTYRPLLSNGHMCAESPNPGSGATVIGNLELYWEDSVLVNAKYKEIVG